MATPMEDSRRRPVSTFEAARSGDVAAFELVMRQHERMVLGTAVRLTGSIEDARDVSQEVFLKLYRNLGKVEASGVSSWLYRVTVNACHDWRRRRRPETPIEEAPEPRDDAGGPQQAVTEEERRRALQVALGRLGEKERAALVLRDLEGLSTEEVARVLGSSEATVRSQISKARVKVKGYVERYFGRRS
jgi:RNA polymerase sigma-70 factor (ECF subfamily)